MCGAFRAKIKRKKCERDLNKEQQENGRPKIQFFFIHMEYLLDPRLEYDFLNNSQLGQKIFRPLMEKKNGMAAFNDGCIFF